MDTHLRADGLREKLVRLTNYKSLTKLVRGVQDIKNIAISRFDFNPNDSITVVEDESGSEIEDDVTFFSLPEPIVLMLLNISKEEMWPGPQVWQAFERLGSVSPGRQVKSNSCGNFIFVQIVKNIQVSNVVLQNRRTGNDTDFKERESY